MSLTTLDNLKNLDASQLTEIVRQDQRSPTFEILDWKVNAIHHAKIVSTTGGLFHFSGHGEDQRGVQSWSVVLKILNNPGEWAQVQDEVFYWKREMELFASGMVAHLPDTLRLPRCYGGMEHEGEGWLWMEYIHESTERRWSLEHFGQAARQLGRFAGSYLMGRPLPDHAWLCKPLFRTLLADGGGWVTFMDPELPDNAWESPRVQACYAEPLRSRVLAMWTYKNRFSDALDRLPQVFCHNDMNRRNLMISKNANGQDEVIAFDWAWCGNGALGLDLGWMMADALFFFDFDFARAAELETVLLDAYTAGLRDAGWSGDERLARLGFLIPLAFWLGVLPGWTATMLDQEPATDTIPMFGRPPDAVQAGWVAVAEFLTARDDAARQLMRELKLD